MEKNKIKRTPKDLKDNDNVFLSDFSIKCYTVVTKEEFTETKGIKAKESIVTSLGNSISKTSSRDIELEKFVIEYSSYYNEDLGTIIDVLSDGAFRLYDYIKRNTKKGKSYICLDKYAYMKFRNIKSIKTWYGFEKELIDAGIIYQTENHGGWYWVNPKFYYVGYRMSDLKQYKKRVDKTK
jgi:hypothetical protein